MKQSLHESKTRFLDAALHVIRCRGYAATRIEDVCAAAGLTKGSFFHHFTGKEDLALSAIAYWDDQTGSFFAAAPFQTLATPLDRLIAYVEFRKAIVTGDLPEFTCLVGTMVQEIYATRPLLRDACNASITGHAATLEADIAAAVSDAKLQPTWTPRSLALYTQAVIQGAFVLAKADNSREVAVDCIEHLRNYFELLFRVRDDVKSGEG